MAKIAFTAGRVAAFKCPVGKSQAFLWDSTTSGLGLRTTPAGKPSYIFQAEYQGKSLRMTIGSPEAWSIAHAQVKARELQRQIDEGRDPREIKAANIAVDLARREGEKRNSITVDEVWQRYLVEGRPKRKDAWKPRYRADLELMASPGGQKKKRGKGLTRPGPIYPLLALRLADVNEDSLKSWYDIEELKGKHQAARALMMFRGFLRWSSARPEYRALTNREAGRSASIMEVLPQVAKRTDCLQAAQVAGWFAGTQQLANRTADVYLNALLLTGARREEMAALRWTDVDFRWRNMTLLDKVELTRTIPLTSYLAQLLKSLPRINQFVFASKAKSGHLIDARVSLANVRQQAGISRLTFHGLRRSFSLFGEAAGASAGAIAQIMGHQPSATAEGYRPRSIDALRPILGMIEAHILKTADLVTKTDVAVAGLTVRGVDIDSTEQ